VLGICAAAYCLRTERWNLAGIVVCGALLQPNVGVPAALACLICVPRARRALVATTLVLAGISLAVLGVAGNAEYFGAVLPLQAGAELAASDQYSLARLLVVAGVAPDASLLVAKLAFAVMVAVGVVLAGVIAVRLRSPEAVPLIPPAAVLLGGIYVHDIQMLFALPAALFVAARLRGPLAETLGITALALLIAVWTQRAARAVLVLDALGVAAGVLAVASRADRVRALARAATAAVAVTACVIVFQRAAPPVPTSQIVTAPFGASADELAPAAWARYLQATPALRRPELVLKLPTWFGLVLLLLASLQLGLARRSDEGGEELTPARSARREPPLASAS